MIDLITLALALKKSKSYTDSAIAALPHGVRYQGEVNYYADLPAAPNLGDYYTVKYAGVSPSTVPSGQEYIWIKEPSAASAHWLLFGEDGKISPLAIAPDYTQITFPVAVGKLCTKSGKLYTANTAIPASEEWTAAHWAETTVEERLDSKVEKVAGKQLSTEDYTTAEQTKLSGIEAGADVTAASNVKASGATMGVKLNGAELIKDSDGKVNVVPTAEDVAYNSSTAYSSGSVGAALSAQSSEIAGILSGDWKQYGVRGIGQSNPTLTRILDSANYVAQVGTDGDNSAVRNDFDHAAPFMRRKCVGTWSAGANKAVFTVGAYKGDPDYAEDGTVGDYVAVDCPPAYYKFDSAVGELIICSHKMPGFTPFACLDDGTGVCRPHTYLPAYALSLDANGKPQSFPGAPNEQGDYKSLFDKCKLHATVGQYAMLMPAAVNFYEWALFTVEFATTNCQSIMNGACNLVYRNTDLVTCKSQTSFLFQGTAINASLVIGECFCIAAQGASQSDASKKATHVVTAVENCDQDGTLNPSGAYRLITVNPLTTATYTVDETYCALVRPYISGSCSGVGTPSGSPGSNADGYHPMQYRWRENVYANQYQTTVDMMNARVGTGDADWKLEWYTHDTPWTITPANYGSVAALAGAGWQKLDIETSHENYRDGYIKSKLYSATHHDLWIPGITTGGSASTYFSDYAYLVDSSAVRSLRLGGYWSYGAIAGFSTALASIAPSLGLAFYSGGLFLAQ